VTPDFSGKNPDKNFQKFLGIFLEKNSRAAMQARA
jgi:hypothetical protein